ncbi:MAG: ABC transporter permease subunit [Streptosporangiales bacterium]|nr:ABC transporter permease subunit [Streptosporangiales bacterium]
MVDTAHRPDSPPRDGQAARTSVAAGRGTRTAPNVLGGLAGLLWLVIVVVPVYWLVVTSLKDQAGFLGGNPLLPGEGLTLDNYRDVLAAGFVRYLANSVVVAFGTVAIVVLTSLMAAHTIVRSPSRFVRTAFKIFLLGLAIPAQATIIPVYFVITRLHLYDTLLALVLPSAAFGIPLTVLILTGFLRDVPTELFDSMRIDGATEWQVLWRLAAPLSRPALITVTIYNALQVWNGFLFPLILTQSAEARVLPLALWSFQGEFTINVPAVLAAVVLSTIPLLVLYVVGRRQLISGLTAGFSR